MLRHWTSGSNGGYSYALPEIFKGGQVTNVSSTHPDNPLSARTWFDGSGPIPSLGALAPFVFTTLQLGLLFVVLRLLQIEPETGLSRVLPLLFVGFIVHAWLPLQWRLPFFLALSMVASGIVLGPVPAGVLIVLALVLFGICHLPIAFSLRVVALVLTGCILAAFRLERLEFPLAFGADSRVPRVVLPVLASMFMFRVIIYMYDLRHEERTRRNAKPGSRSVERPATPWARFSYFFLLPNVCFLLFPIVDYRTYRRTYYDKAAQLIYQKGVWLIFLGTVQLLAYRAVYHFLLPSPEEVQGIAGIVRFMTSAYLIYFRVVGQFHLIIGLLCLFGFNLPPAHRFFLLASSYTDFWRRARIEWKDFMVKVFYYPALVPLQRKFGPTSALIASTIVVFVATWLLHGYQWFWLIGDFRLLGNDGVFWIIIGSCVLVNSVLEMRKRRESAGPNWSTMEAAIRSAKILGMFVFMSVLWSYWSSPSYRIWMSYLTAAKESSLAEYAALLVAVAAIVAFGVAVQFFQFNRAARVRGPVKQGPPVRRAPTPETFWSPSGLWRSAVTVAGALLILVVSRGEVRSAFPSTLDEAVVALSTNSLNAVDQEREDRGYYEELLDVPRSTAALAASAGELKRASGTTTNPGVDENQTAVEEDSTAAGAEPDSVRGPSGRPTSSLNSPSTDEQGEVPIVSPVTAIGAKPSAAIAVAIRDSSQISRNAEDVATPDDAAVRETSDASGAKVYRAARRLRNYERLRNDVLMWENTPGAKGDFRGEAVEINRWGMRARDYSLKRPANTYRIALVGTSMTFGPGVQLDKTMATLLENRLNREGPGAPQRRFEILNFSVGAYGIVQNVAVIDKKALGFSPDAILVGIFSLDIPRTSDYLRKLVKSRYDVPWPYLAAKLKESGATPDMQAPELQRRLAPIAEDIVKWSYRQIMETASSRGIRVIGVVLPEPRMKAPQDLDEAARFAADAGMPLIDLRGVYEGLPEDSLHIDGTEEAHWNVRGHQLIASHVFALLQSQGFAQLKIGGTRAKAGAVPGSR